MSYFKQADLFIKFIIAKGNNSTRMLYRPNKAQGGKMKYRGFYESYTTLRGNIEYWNLSIDAVLFSSFSIGVCTRVDFNYPFQPKKFCRSKYTKYLLIFFSMHLNKTPNFFRIFETSIEKIK